MLGLVLLYFIGKYYFELAKKNQKNGWLFAILGIVSYYVGTFIGGLVLAILYELFATSSIDDLNEYALGFMALPFGLLMCWGLYKFLESTWNKKSSLDNNEILDSDLI